MILFNKTFISTSHLLLPPEIVMQITSCFPKKSLIRFKSVCKFWCTVFSNSDFMLQHFVPDQNIVFVKHRDKNTYEYELSLLYDDVVISSESLLLPPCPHDSYGPPHVAVIGSCCFHGIMCLKHRDRIVLWNVITRDVKIVPHRDVIGRYLQSEFGFGYDENSQDYKVIMVTPFSIDETKCDGSSKSDSWRALDCEPPAIIFPSNGESGLYTDGVFSWLALRPPDETWAFSVLGYRASDDSFGTFKLPPNSDDDGCPIYDNERLVLNEQMAYIMFDYKTKTERCFRVWGLVEFGVEESWTLLFTVGPLTQIERPLSFWRNHKIIMRDDDEDLILVDPLNYEMKSLNIGGLTNNKKDIQIVSIPANYFI